VSPINLLSTEVRKPADPMELDKEMDSCKYLINYTLL
jgi:hypothetical protein